MKQTKSSAGERYLVRRWTMVRRGDYDKSEVVAAESKIVESYSEVKKMLEENYANGECKFSNFHVSKLFPKINANGEIEFVEERLLKSELAHGCGCRADERSNLQVCNGSPSVTETIRSWVVRMWVK